MKCPNCGYEIEKPNMKTCPVCGHKLNRKVQIEPQSPSMAQSKEEAILSEEDPQEEMTLSSQQEEVSQNVSQVTSESKLVECPNCHRGVQEESNFCPHCGCNMHSLSRIIEEQEPIIEKQMEESTQFDTSAEPASSFYNDEDSEQPLDESPSESTLNDNDEEYIENGSYQPYHEEEEVNQEEEAQKTDKSGSSWIAIIVTAIISVLLGALLNYLVF